MGLGDVVERALKTVGITQELVARWVGPECGCEERRRKLNSLGVWAARVAQGRVANARQFLEGILGLNR